MIEPKALTKKLNKLGEGIVKSLTELNNAMCLLDDKLVSTYSDIRKLDGRVKALEAKEERRHPQWAIGRLVDRVQALEDTERHWTQRMAQMERRLEFYESKLTDIKNKLKADEGKEEEQAVLTDTASTQKTRVNQ